MADNDEVATPDAIIPEVPQTLTTRDMVTAIVKDDDDSARAAFHQVLQTKMRDRISPPAAETTDGEDSDNEDNGEGEETT